MYEKELFIDSRRISINDEPYFIADVGANHDGSLDRAFKLIELAKESGADAVKFQNFIADKIVSKYGFENLEGNSTHQSNWKKSVFDTYVDASLSREWTIPIVEKCREIEITYFTSPYDFDSVDHVESYLDAYKIGSGDVNWLEILEYIAKKDKTVLLATGAASLDDVKRAVDTILSFNKKLCLMQCNTNYTVDHDKSRHANLNVLKTFADLYPGIVLGLSDHSMNPATVVASIPLGARVFEKHFTDDKKREGPDHKFAVDPKEWKEMVFLSKEAFYALGDGIKKVEENEIESRIVQQRCLRASRNILKGEIFTRDMVEVLRPCPDDAFRPWEINKIIGKKASIDIEFGDALRGSSIDDK